MFYVGKSSILGLNIFLFFSPIHTPRPNPPLPTKTVFVAPTRPVITATPTIVSLKQKIAVPSYFYPGSSGWTRMEQNSSTSSLAIINPDSGPGASQNQDYVDQVTQAKSAGMNVIGYVSTSYAGTQDHTRTLAAVERDIDTYYRWYPDIDGIFVDEVSTDCNKASSYYKPLYDYIKQKGEAVIVVLNPGTNISQCYMDVGDIIVNFDDTYANYVNWSPSPWVQKYPASHFWQIVAGVSSANMSQAIAYSKSRNAGWIYMTNEAGSNPFASLPSYWDDELQQASNP